MSIDARHTESALQVGDLQYRYYSLRSAEALGCSGISKLPRCLKLVLENLLRQSAAGIGRTGDVEKLLCWRHGCGEEVAFLPVRVMMDDTAGLPSIGDLAAMRDEVARLGGDPGSVDLRVPLDFVVDHSVIADYSASPDALARNMALELDRNAERFRFLRWAEQAFNRLRVFPPGSGICHQINLEYLAQVICSEERDGTAWAYPDSVIGIDSHTPMINGLGILGWGVSGMEGLGAALGERAAFALSRVIGCRLHGRLRPGTTATDAVLTLTRFLRERDRVGQVIEYCGPGLDALTLQDRATIANMTPEAGATMSYFPIDAETMRYLACTGRTAQHLALVEAYARAQGLWHDDDAPVDYSETMDFDLGAVVPSLSGPRLPHNRIALADAPRAFDAAYRAKRSNVEARSCTSGLSAQDARRAGSAGSDDRDRDTATQIEHGDVVLAAIASCTNTSNPALMIAAGLLARNAVRCGLRPRTWVKTSFSPGSRAVVDYLARSGLQPWLDALGFNVVGFGCMACVGFSGPLAAPVERALAQKGVEGVSVLSGNRNYEGRAHPLVRASFLASPPLVIAYALAGSVLKDLTKDPLGESRDGRGVLLADIWPNPDEVRDVMASAADPQCYRRAYRNVLAGTPGWQRIAPTPGLRYAWNETSTFIRPPSLPADTSADDLRGARILAMFGDMVTTEHISPMGVIPIQSEAGRYLEALGIAPGAFVSYAARRLNDEVMVRGTFASPHLYNELAPEHPGGFTRHMPDGAIMPIYEAAQRYRAQGVPLVVVAGSGFGAGSSRDWAAKGPRLLGVRAVLAESYERIYRASLAAAGVLPLQFTDAMTRADALLDGAESIDIPGVANIAEPRERLRCIITRADGLRREIPVMARLDSKREVDYFRHGGLLGHLLKRNARDLPLG